MRAARTVPGLVSRLVLRPGWLTDRAVYVLALVTAIVSVIAATFVIVLILRFRSDEQWLLMDFTAFWAAAVTALDGNPATAYDWGALKEIQKAAIGADFPVQMPWHYPPSFQLLVAPLGMLPLFAAHGLWSLATLGIYLLAVHAIFPGRTAVLAAFAPATTAILVVNGQTGFLTAALTGLGLLWWRRLPNAAGIAIGLLSIKPQLALGFPIALIAAGRWRILAVAALSALGLAALSWAALGIETWRAFLDSTGAAVATLENFDRWFLHASAYGGMRHLGFGFGGAMAVQGVVSIAVGAALWHAMRSDRAGPDFRAALIAYACIAFSPRVMDYDILTLFIGALFHVRHARVRGFFPGECMIFLIAPMITLGDLLLASAVNALVAPLLVAALLVGERFREPSTARMGNTEGPTQAATGTPAGLALGGD